MKILAVEFSSEQRSVAVAVDGEVRSTAMEAATRATPAFALIETALAEARLEREQIECLAIGLGPGSYTGIRAAIALAQGWQLATNVKLLGISSMECLAAEARAQECRGRIHIVVDAQRNELYWAQYEIAATGAQEIAPLKLTAPDEVLARGNNSTIIGPDATGWFPQARVLFPTARSLAQLAVNRSDFVAGEKVEPIYLRETSFVKAQPPRFPSAG